MTDKVVIAIDQGGHATRASAYSAAGELEGAALVTVAPQRWAAAGLAVQRSSLVCWSADDGRALSPVISWQDTRNAAWLRGLSRRADDVARLTGLQLSPP